MRIALIALVGVLAAAPITARAQGDSFRERRERFQLFANCARVVPNLTLQVAEDSDIEGLTEERLQQAIDSQLRAAGLYMSPDSARLRPAGESTTVRVDVHVVGQGFQVDVQHEKLLQDLLTSEVGYVPTWERGSTGTHGGDGEYIVDGVAPLLDDFVNDYLRVNEPACAR